MGREGVSNPQPDRYERPALTIELPALRGAREDKAQNASDGNAVSHEAQGRVPTR